MGFTTNLKLNLLCNFLFYIRIAYYCLNLELISFWLITVEIPVCLILNFEQSQNVTPLSPVSFIGV